MIPARLEQGVFVASLVPENIGNGGKEDIEEFLHKTLQSLPSGTSAILVDMDGVRLIRSSGLGALLSACEKLKARGIKMAVCRVPPFGRNLFKISGLDQFLLVFATVEDGLNALGWGDAEAGSPPGDPSPH